MTYLKIVSASDNLQAPLTVAAWRGSDLFASCGSPWYPGDRLLEVDVADEPLRPAPASGWFWTHEPPRAIRALPWTALVDDGHVYHAMVYVKDLSDSDRNTLVHRLTDSYWCHAALTDHRLTLTDRQKDWLVDHVTTPSHASDVLCMRRPLRSGHWQRLLDVVSRDAGAAAEVLRSCRLLPDQARKLAAVVRSPEDAYHILRWARYKSRLPQDVLAYLRRLASHWPKYHPDLW